MVNEWIGGPRSEPEPPERERDPDRIVGTLEVARRDTYESVRVEAEIREPYNLPNISANVLSAVHAAGQELWT